MYTLSGGSFVVRGSSTIQGDIIRGTLEQHTNGKFVMSIYAGALTIGTNNSPSGMITISGTLSDLNYVSNSLEFNFSSASVFMTANISEYQKYSVQMELFDFASCILSDLATPTYEFSLNSGNFIFAEEFASFRKNLELGCGIYLRLHDGYVITPLVIEFELDFKRLDSLSMIFSNRFKRRDNVNTLKDMLESSYSASRSFDANKYIYNQAVNQSSQVSQFMNSSLDAAKNTILSGKGTVVQDGTGLTISGDSKYQIRMVDRMIAMTDDGWQSAKLAIGLFASPETGEYWGVNADVIGGKLIVGNNLVIENKNDNGIIQFKVDSSGAWLNNSTFVLQKDNSGKLIIDPAYGILAGNKGLFTTEGTTIMPSFVDKDGNIVLDSDGMPTGTNFYLDIRDGSAYFRGVVNAISGEIGGWTLEEDYFHSGNGTTYVAMNASGRTNSAYAIWAGASSPDNAPFWVKKNGDIYCRNGTFKGVVYGAQYKDSAGNIMMNSSEQFKSKYLSLYGLTITNGTDTTFSVTSNGDVTVKGNIKMGAGSSIDWGSVSEYNVSHSKAYSQASTAIDLAGRAYNFADAAYDYADTAYELAYDNMITDKKVFDILTNGGTKFGIFSDSTTNRLYINANYIHSGTIDADIISLASSYGGFCCATGHDGSRKTYGAKMYGSNGMKSAPYFIVTNTGCRMTADDKLGVMDLYITENGICASEEITVISDKRLKHDIEYNMKAYEDFFMALRPTAFKYNSGKSERYHIGFIAQDVARAIEDGNLQTTDFAGFVIEEMSEPFCDITGDIYKLRYGEFIALNTHMIQKLYKRIEFLESKLQEFERVLL